jgi:hypothetical protein
MLRGGIDVTTEVVLFDLQTSGGLLAGIPAQSAPDCVAAVRSAGHAHAAIIGWVRKVGVVTTGATILVDGAFGASGS